MDQKLIGRFIMQLRKEKGMTQSEFAQKLGVTDKAVSKWETGRSMPDISLLRPVSEALSITVNELLSGERIQNEPVSAQLDISIINMLGIVQKLEKGKYIFLGLVLLVIGIALLLISQGFEPINGVRDSVSGFFIGMATVILLGGVGIVSFGIAKSLKKE